MNGWPSRELEREVIDALVRELRTRGRGVSFLDRLEARKGAQAALRRALAELHEDDHREAVRDWHWEAAAIVSRARDRERERAWRRPPP